MIAAGSALGFAGVAVWFAVEGSLPYDRRVLSATYDAVGTDFDDPARVIARAATAWIVAPIALCAAIVFATQKRWGALVLVVGAALLTWVANPILKQLFARDRPAVRPLVEPVSRFSFPSGHAVTSMALACVVVVLGWSTRGRGFALAGALLYVAIVAATQITLGVHFPSDLLAAWLLALAVMTLLAAGLFRWGRLSR